MDLLEDNGKAIIVFTGWSIDWIARTDPNQQRAEMRGQGLTKVWIRLEAVGTAAPFARVGFAARVAVQLLRIGKLLPVSLEHKKEGAHPHHEPNETSKGNS